MLLVAGLILGGLALLLVLNTASAANEVRRHDLSAQDEGIAASVQELQNEVAASAAPQNLAQAAAALGMVPAMNPAFVVIAGDGRVRVLGNPAPVAGIVVARPTPTPTPSKSSSASSTATSTSSSSSTATSTSSSTATSTSSSTATSTSSSTATSTAHGTPSSSSTATSSTTPTPTPTPTPTLTLPGGNR